MYKNFFKRFFDFVFSAVLIVLLLPVFFAVWLLIRLKMGSPAIFKQARPGRDEKIFYIMKFRTMDNSKDSFGNLLPDEVRLTPLGKFLRKTSLDEIPPLLNVFKGEMSFIGPRPLLPQYLPHYTKEEKLRHSVRPGISGLAQVSGRNCISWDEKLAFDVKYVKNVSFLSDLKIAVLTLKKVLRCEGVNCVPNERSLCEERGGGK